MSDTQPEGSLSIGQAIAIGMGIGIALARPKETGRVLSAATRIGVQVASDPQFPALLAAALDPASALGLTSAPLGAVEARRDGQEHPEAGSGPEAGTAGSPGLSG